MANPVVGATKYEFEFSLAGNVYATKLQNSNQLSIASVSPAFQWGNTYQVRIRVHIGNVIGNYGNICSIGFINDPNSSGIPFTQLVAANCGRLNFPINGALGANPVSSATRYEFEFSQGGIVYATRISLNRFCGFNVISPALQSGQQYEVRVRAHIGNVVGNYGPNCLIGLVGGARFEPSYEAQAEDYNLMEGEEFPISFSNTKEKLPIIQVLPNPFTEQTLLQTENIEEGYSVSVYAADGRRIEHLQNQRQQSLLLGNQLPKGIYLIEVKSQNGFSKFLKVIKTE